MYLPPDRGEVTVKLVDRTDTATTK